MNYLVHNVRKPVPNPIARFRLIPFVTCFPLAATLSSSKLSSVIRYSVIILYSAEQLTVTVLD